VRGPELPALDILPGDQPGEAHRTVPRLDKAHPTRLPPNYPLLNFRRHKCPPEERGINAGGRDAVGISIYVRSACLARRSLYKKESAWVASPMV